jgi:hypothetical protein
VRSFNYVRKWSEVDYLFVAIFIGWVAYLAQSLVSINQLGLAIWGWIFMGLLLGRTSVSKNAVIKPKLDKYKSSELLPAGNFVTILVAIILFGALALPPVVSERLWFLDLKKGELQKVESRLSAWPQSNQRYIYTAQMLVNSKNYQSALEVVRKGTTFDPDFRDYWYFIYYLTSDKIEKNKAKTNLERLDPLNKSPL